MGGSCAKKNTLTDDSLEHHRTASLQVSVLGQARGVGKSALCSRFVTESFDDNYYDEAIEESYERIVNLDDREVKFNILDTHGAEEYCAMLPSWIRVSEAYLVIYDLTDRKTFDYLQQLNYKSLIMYMKHSINVPKMLLIGNKLDLEESREVSTIEGEALAKDWGVGFMETSAKSGENLYKAFLNLLEQCQMVDMKNYTTLLIQKTKVLEKIFMRSVASEIIAFLFDELEFSVMRDREECNIN